MKVSQQTKILFLLAGLSFTSTYALAQIAGDRDLSLEQVNQKIAKIEKDRYTRFTSNLRPQMAQEFEKQTKEYEKLLYRKSQILDSMTQTNALLKKEAHLEKKMNRISRDERIEKGEKINKLLESNFMIESKAAKKMIAKLNQMELQGHLDSSEKQALIAKIQDAFFKAQAYEKAKENHIYASARAIKAAYRPLFDHQIAYTKIKIEKRKALPSPIRWFLNKVKPIKKPKGSHYNFDQKELKELEIFNASVKANAHQKIYPQGFFSTLFTKEQNTNNTDTSNLKASDDKVISSDYKTCTQPESKFTSFIKSLHNIFISKTLKDSDFSDCVMAFEKNHNNEDYGKDGVFVSPSSNRYQEKQNLIDISSRNKTAGEVCQNLDLIDFSSILKGMIREFEKKPTYKTMFQDLFALLEKTQNPEAELAKWKEQYPKVYKNIIEPYFRVLSKSLSSKSDLDKKMILLSTSGFYDFDTTKNAERLSPKWSLSGMNSLVKQDQTKTSPVTLVETKIDHEQAIPSSNSKPKRVWTRGILQEKGIVLGQERATSQKDTQAVTAETQLVNSPTSGIIQNTQIIKLEDVPTDLMLALAKDDKEEVLGSLKHLDLSLANPDAIQIIFDLVSKDSEVEKVIKEALKSNPNSRNISPASETTEITQITQLSDVPTDLILALADDNKEAVSSSLKHLDLSLAQPDAKKLLLELVSKGSEVEKILEEAMGSTPNSEDMNDQLTKAITANDYATVKAILESNKGLNLENSISPFMLKHIQEMRIKDRQGKIDHGTLVIAEQIEGLIETYQNKI